MENKSFSDSSFDSSKYPSREFHPFLTAVLVVFVIGSMAIGYYFFYQPSRLLVSETTEEPIEQVQEKNPITHFYQNFSAKDYRIKTRPKKEQSGFTQVTTYYQRGKMVRLDIDASGKSSTVIFKEGKMYNLNHLEKTFVEEDENNPFLSRFVNIYKIISLVDVLVMSETPNAPKWELLPLDPGMPNWVGYESMNREVNLRSIEGPAYMDMRIYVDPKTGLIMAATMNLAGKQNFEENMTLLEYQEIADIELLKRFPEEYKKQDLFDTLKFTPQNQNGTD